MKSLSKVTLPVSGKLTLKYRPSDSEPTCLSIMSHGPMGLCKGIECHGDEGLRLRKTSQRRGHFRRNLHKEK